MDSGKPIATDAVAIFVIAQKADVAKAHPGMSEDHIKDEVMMRLAREVMNRRAFAAYNQTPGVTAA